MADVKCDRCKEAEATVYFASVSGKGKASRHRYCPKCAKEERIRLTPPPAQPAQPSPPASVLGLVQKELDKSAAGEKTASETPEQATRRLNKAMQAAISKEDYEAAAKLRDQIAALRPMNSKDAKP